MPTKTHARSKERMLEIRRAVEKIVVNAGVGRASNQPGFAEKTLKNFERDFALITGEKAALRPAKKSIAGFKIREGQIVGLKATLRGRKMVDFLERLITMVMPRVHDFRGIGLNSVDKGGSLNIGFREQFVFPEVNPEESPVSFSLGVNIVPREKNRTKALEAYRHLGLPLRTGNEPAIINGKKRKLG